MEKLSETLQQILNAGMEEFQEKGFRDASLRNIVKSAGVTTGAFYGYYSSKEALFAALVEPHAAAIMGWFMTAQTNFAALPREEQPAHMGKESSECIDWIIDYIYDHYEPCKLLICRSSGTVYEQFIHNMVEVEVEYTFHYMDTLRSLGRQVPRLESELCHIITSGMFEGMFEVLRHDMPKDRAKRFIKRLEEFSVAGWREIMER